jgi:hypothetical protein
VSGSIQATGALKSSNRWPANTGSLRCFEPKGGERERKQPFAALDELREALKAKPPGAGTGDCRSPEVR